MPLSKLFESYLKEKKYMGGLSQETLDSYTDVYKRWIKYIGDEMPTTENLSEWIIAMSEAGLKTTTINISIRSWNVFLHWLHDNGHTKKFFKLQKVKEPKRTMKAISETDVEKILNWRPNPKDRMETRLYAMLCTLADTGMRIDELLTIQIENIQWEDFLIFVIGKGRKERFVPMSIELRKILYAFVQKHRKAPDNCSFLFCSINGTKLMYHNMYRDFRVLMERLGIDRNKFDGHFHTFRRFFGKNFLREGGNTIYLQQIFGHSNIATTQRYVEVEKEDLRRTHKKTSFLSKVKKFFK